jgi:hypothetical protein
LFNFWPYCPLFCTLTNGVCGLNCVLLSRLRISIWIGRKPLLRGGSAVMTISHLSIALLVCPPLVSFTMRSYIRKSGLRIRQRMGYPSNCGLGSCWVCHTDLLHTCCSANTAIQRRVPLYSCLWRKFWARWLGPSERGVPVIYERERRRTINGVELVEQLYVPNSLFYLRVTNRPRHVQS